MKTLLLSIIAISILFVSLYPNLAKADSGIEIQDIKTIPAAIIIGHTFKINATLVNNSTNPIDVEHGSCQAPFSATFDNHVLTRINNVTCTTEMVLQKINPGQKITTTSPYLDLAYVAKEAGAANATITFRYLIWNETNQSNKEENVSSPFSFTINPITKVPTLTPSGNQELIDIATSIPGIQSWSHDWQFVTMGFMTANNQPGNWQYAIVELKAPSNSAPFPCADNWWARVVIDRSTMQVVDATYPTMENHGCGGMSFGGGPLSLAEKSDNVTKIESPLAQFKSGIAANKIQCNTNLVLIFKLEDGSPACVSQQTKEQLLKRGWGVEGFARTESTMTSHPNSIRDTSFIKLFLTTNSTIIRQGQAIGLDISLNNTYSSKISLNSDNHWGLSDLGFEPCIPRPYGIAVFDGYYTEQNMTDGRPLLIFNPDALCPAINSTNSYVFDHESTNATVSTCSDSSLPYCTYSQDMHDKVSISGTWDEGNLHPFNAGIYTLVGGDEWGHLLIQHFAVTNSTIFAGNLGGMSCPAVQFGIDTKIENTTGFTFYSPSRHFDNLVLAAGNTGHLTLTYNYSRPTNGSPDIVGKPLNLTNYGVLAYMANVMSQKSLLAQYEITISPDLPWQPLHVCHYNPQIGGQETPCYTDQYKIISQIGPGPIPYNPGVSVDIEPKWIMISPNSTSTFTATISANKTALPGAYWVSLGHGYCGPSQRIELAIQ